MNHPVYKCTHRSVICTCCHFEIYHGPADCDPTMLGQLIYMHVLNCFPQVKVRA